MNDYHDLYSKVDVLVGYSWDVMLRLIDVNFKLISNIEKYQFVESRIRVSISVVCKGYAEAKNNLQSYDANKPTSYITHLDDNKLYGHSMLQLFPTKILNWVDLKDFNQDNYSNDSPIGCLFEVDLDYPDELHDLHNDYSLAGEKYRGNKRYVCRLSIKNHRR